MIRADQMQRPQLVLVVDDQEINRDALGAILEDDYEVIYAENGREAVNQMKVCEEELSVVLLDLMMPVMDGYEVLEYVHADSALRRIPIVVLTADRSAELRALQLGAADFITKPFDLPEVILARVARIIELSEGRQLISSAEHDRLTMLYTGNFFNEYANRLFHYHPELHLDAVSLNIEQFHTINALNGRDFGDEVLRLMGRVIRDFLKGTDGIAGRFQADRFDIYCVHQDDYRAVLKDFQKQVNGFSPNVNIHLRMGVQPWQEDVEPIVLFDRARAACNMVRGNYQNPVMIYDDEMRKKELFAQRLLNDLRSAVEDGQFKVFYQPKYDIQSDPPRLSSAEALIRWQHPELGMISPGEFIPLFEGNGLISIVDNYVWKEAAEQVARWRELYGFTLPVSVNLSRSDVFDRKLVDRLVRLVAENNLAYADIKLEITESAYTADNRQVIDVAKTLRRYGFEIEMDDFGSGYSSLNMLSDLPIDVLKMDMRFVHGIEKSETDMRLVKLILDIARYLNLRVVAEGVETVGQLELLKNAGCDLVQGFHFSPPVPPEKFEEMIRQELAIKEQEKQS